MLATVTSVTEPVSSGREQWLVAGQELLRRGGIGAVKLQALTDQLGLTTGSFYHHFGGMKEYREELARCYGADLARRNLELVADPDPRQRLLHLGEVAREQRMVMLDAAMRDWAGSDPLAADSVRAADEQLLRFLASAFEDLGYPGRDAELRAQLMLSIAVARVMPPWKSVTGELEPVLRILAP